MSMYPIELKLTSYPYKDNHDIYYIQCKSNRKIDGSGLQLHHPDNDHTLYVMYLTLDQIQLKWTEDALKQSTSTFLTQSDMSFLKRNILNLSNHDYMTKVFDTLIIYELWVDSWNKKYGSIYKLII